MTRTLSSPLRADSADRALTIAARGTIARLLHPTGSLLGAMLALSTGLTAAHAAELIVTVEPASVEGKVMLALYDSAADFRQRAVFTQAQDAKDSPARFRFDQLPPGDYAVAVYQDVNSNGKLDTNLVGIPREPYGFSQEPKGLMGPPGWDKVKFAVPQEGTTIHIRLAP